MSGRLLLRVKTLIIDTERDQVSDFVYLGIHFYLDYNQSQEDLRKML